MLWWLFITLFGEYIFAIVPVLQILLSGENANSTDPVNSTFIKNADFMFPENFLSRYPHEAEPFRLKIYGYLLFNLLVKGYGSTDPPSFWSNYNSDDFYRAVIDAAFYEYLTNFTDREAKDGLFNPLENTENIFSEPISDENIAVDRIGQYLDHLSESESQPEMIKGAYDIISEANESPVIFERQTTECNEHIPIQTLGFPGIDYPNFCDIPKTSFSCAGKRIPGIYADYETGCQVFHVCWPRRKDSFLCPIGTIFNQSLLTCDIWHDTGCFSSPLFRHGHFLTDAIFTELDIPSYDENCEGLLLTPLRLRAKFLPAKCESRDALVSKMCDKCTEQFKAKLLMTCDLIEEMIEILTKMKEAEDKKNKGSSKIRVLAKNLNTIPERSTQTEEVTEFIRKLGETDSEQQMVAEQVMHSEKLPSGVKPGLSVTRSSLIEPSKSLEEHIKSSRKQDVPEIVMKSLRLGGTFLDEGVIPLAKQVMIDSYRKMESKYR